MTNLFNY